MQIMKHLLKIHEENGLQHLRALYHQVGKRECYGHVIIPTIIHY